MTTDYRTLRNRSRRYPWSAVDEYISRQWELGGDGTRNSRLPGWRSVEPMPPRKACDLLGLAESTYHKMRKNPDLSDRQADMIATNLGLHPALLWPDWFAKA